MKVLIFMSESDLKPIWWPSWYLYNLNEWLSKIDKQDISICFLHPKVKETAIGTIFSKIKKFKLWRLLIHYLYIIHLIVNNGRASNIDFSKYDIVHFHTTTDFYINRNNLKNYAWKIVLTSHSPMPTHQEIVDYLQIKNVKYKKFLLSKLEKIDIHSFNHADCILFPCKEAEECYYNQWDKYKEIHENNKNKYIYLETGLIPIIIKESKNDLRKKYDLKNNYILCYVWRHNEVKWYDSLRRLWEKYLNKNKNASFLIAWKEDPLKWLNDERWKEIWWTNKPYEIIKSSDVFILPNKETYFDLILLEVLSLWKPVVLTRTWWNKYFEKFKDSGLFFYDYDNQEEFNSILDNLSNQDLDEIWMKNKKLFDKYFTSEVFAKNYINMYKKFLYF